MADDTDSAIDQLPLKGTVLCCTSVSQDVRTKVSEIATQMGAVHNLDLTAEVTHLIVGNVTTPKYRYVAKERPDIAVLHPDWIEAVRQAWMDGGDVDISVLVNKHRMPTFYGMKTCVTGFADMEQRNRISSIMEEQGAEYHGDLTKQVTHLVVAAPTGAKFNAAKSWGINVVSYKWFEDSVQRGMALDESLYDPHLPEEEQGKGAFRTSRPRTSLGKRTRVGEMRAAGDDPGKRKLRRTASSRLNSQSLDLWQGLSARETDTEQPTEDQWKDEPARDKEHANKEARQHTPSITHPQPTEPTQEKQGLLAGCHAFIHGFSDASKCRRLKSFLETNGAILATSTTGLEEASAQPSFTCAYLLVPHSLEAGPVQLPEVPSGTKIVTEWWLERCAHWKIRFDPDEDVLSGPLWDIMIPEFTGFTISTTGLSGVDLRQVAGAVKLTGATYCEQLVPSVSVLVSGSENIKKEKSYYATKHNIPVVSSEWLWSSLKQKRKMPFEKYRFALGPVDPKGSFRDSPTMSPIISGAQEKPRKDKSQPPRLSNTRKQPKAMSLPLEAAKPVPRKSGPFVDDEDDDEPPQQSDLPSTDVASSPKRAQPLGEISPNVSPRKAGHVSNEDGDENKDTEEKPITLDDEQATMPVSPPESGAASPQRQQQTATEEPQNQEALAANLASLLHRATTSTTSASDSPPVSKRKNRPLGRNLSGIANSNRSGSPALSLPQSNDRTVVVDAADGFAAPVKESSLPPSTQLGYENLAQDQNRLDLEKRMNVRLTDDGEESRVPKMGTVKDSASLGGRGENGAATRIRRNRAR